MAIFPDFPISFIVFRLVFHLGHGEFSSLLMKSIANSSVLLCNAQVCHYSGCFRLCHFGWLLSFLLASQLVGSALKIVSASFQSGHDKLSLPFFVTFEYKVLLVDKESLSRL
jgi:hypothetical protein